MYIYYKGSFSLTSNTKDHLQFRGNFPQYDAHLIRGNIPLSKLQVIDDALDIRITRGTWTSYITGGVARRVYLRA